MNLLHFLPILLLTLSACNGSDDNKVTAPLPEITIFPVSKPEGNTNSVFDFEVRLSKASDKPVKVDYATKDVTAVAGEDYVATSGTLDFDIGETVRSIAVTVLGDTLREDDEIFHIVLSNPVNAVLGNTTGIGTIRNDDTFILIDDTGFSSPLSYAGWSLVWQDEFDGSGIDPANWKHELGASGWGNNEWQNYTARPENSFVTGGKLVIEARKENYSGSNYTSARMITAGLKEFQYGRVDIRAKLPEGQGIWPALWMLGSDFWTNGWPRCGEIDIMEIIGNKPAELHGTIHWDNGGSHASYGGSTTLPSGKFSDQFHVFSIVWDAQHIRWLLDNEQFHIVDITPAGLSEFHQKFFFIFNVAVGGNWPGYPDATTVFPQRMLVDYIRVFQQ
mgnify:CR=1 FL=1